MFVDPHRLSPPPAIPDAVPPHPANTRPRTASPSAPVVRPAPVLVPPPAAPEDVEVQWDGNNGVIIKFTDKKSGQIMRQIPSEQVLSVARFIAALLQKEGVISTEAQSSSGKTASNPAVHSIQKL
jgi:hypothetical protein